jgi:hypothetical protein
MYLESTKGTASQRQLSWEADILELIGRYTLKPASV